MAVETDLCASESSPEMTAREVLAHCSLFSELEPAALDRLSAHCSLIGISSGAELYAAGEAVDAMYVVIAGRLGARLRDDGPLLQIGRLQTVGEIALITGEKHEVRIRALRDTLLLRIDRDDLLACIGDYPAILLALTREIIRRLCSSPQQLQRHRLHQHHTYAVVPARTDIDPSDFADRLEQALSQLDPTRHIGASDVDAELGSGAAQTGNADGAGNSRVVAYLNALECGTAEGCLVYIASRDADTWSQRCMRQADRILIVAHAGDPPILTPMTDDVLRLAGDTPVDLVLLRRSGQDVDNVVAWRELLRTHTHYFVEPGSDRGFDALARQLTNRGVGLVLGGGGARGFAHLGLLRALEALQIPVDLAGGSSMGAFLAALHASGMDHRQVREVTYDTFVGNNYLNDYQLPRVSLIRGRKLRKHLSEVLGTQRIETLPKPYFCITTNLTRGVATVHDSGELALWVGTSMAIPGIVPPLVWKGELHVDGSVINSLPTDVMKTWSRGPIVASDVATEGVIAAPGIEGPDPEALLNPRTPEDKVTLIDILFRTASLTSESGVKARAERADCYLRMPVGNVGMFERKRLNELADTSYAYAMRKLEPMRDVLLSRIEATDKTLSTPDMV